MFTLCKIRKTNWKCQCKKDKSKFKFTEMSFLQNTKQFKMKDIRSLLSWLREKPKLRILELNMNLLFKKPMDQMEARLNILKPITLSKLLKKEKNFKEKEMNSALKLLKLRKSLRLCKIHSWHQKTQTELKEINLLTKVSVNLTQLRNKLFNNNVMQHHKIFLKRKTNSKKYNLNTNKI